MGRPTVEQVLALAPDASSAAAGERLAAPNAWSGIGHDDRAVWGSCRGSGKVPYQVACDTWGPAYRCTCPSPKFPCKHALALLLLWARGPSPNRAGAPAPAPAPAPAGDPAPTPAPAGTPPAEVAAWLASRATTASPGAIERATNGKALPPGAPPERPGDDSPLTPAADPGAAGARAAKRAARIVAGMEELDRWLRDLVRQGLGRAQNLPYAFWDDMGARLVDAQAPGAAARVRSLAGVARSGDGWPDRMLAQLARLHLLAAGWLHLDALPETVRADLRAAAGWPWPGDEILATATRERDRWYVLARSVTDEEVVRAQRSWLWGLDSGRLAVLVDFARPGAAFSWELWPGNVLNADLARYPGSAPLRALVAERRGDPAPGGPPPAWADLAEAAAARGRAVAADPWLPRWPISLAGAVPAGRPGAWWARDRGGRQMLLATDDATGWRLLALSGGRPVGLLGEWEADRLRPLGVWADGQMAVL